MTLWTVLTLAGRFAKALIMPIRKSLETQENTASKVDKECILSDVSVKGLTFATPLGAVKLDQPVSVIGNLPGDFSVEDDIADLSKRDLTVMHLRRKVAQLTADKKNLNDKLSRVLETLVDEHRMWQLLLVEGQQPTYGEAQRRMIRLQAMVDLIHDMTPGRHTMIDEMKAQKWAK